MYAYLIENATGKIILRSSGAIGNPDPTANTIVHAEEPFDVATHVWDVRTQLFQKVPASAMAAKIRAGLKKIEERKAALRRAAEVFLTLDEQLQEVLEAILVNPDNEVLEAIRAMREERHGEKKGSAEQ